ncbi:MULTISPECIES: hypothetical protein [unclassified Collinsella]|uniref:hypothetical protein n=2 Tax=Coriobacteriaceae TaxID=84107 RepID=UPI0011C18ED2|nr:MULTISPECIES: hypothetical protein [unclassified Collinsella]
MKNVDIGPESVLPPGAFRRGSDILQHEVRSKISLMPEDAPGGSTDSGPDMRIYLRNYKFENFFEKSACTVLES